MIRNLANILDQHSELIEEEMFKLPFSLYDASDHFKLFREHFNTLSEPEEIQTFVKFYSKLEPVYVKDGKKWCLCFLTSAEVILVVFFCILV